MRKEEKEGESDYSTSLILSVRSMVCVCVCAYVCVRVVSLGRLPLRAVKSNLDSKPKCMCVCVYHTMGILSLRPSVHLNHSAALSASPCISRVLLCACVCVCVCVCVSYLNVFPLKWLFHFRQCITDTCTENDAASGQVKISSISPYTAGFIESGMGGVVIASASVL